MKLKFKKAKVESPIIADIFQVWINLATNLLPSSHFEHDNEECASFQPLSSSNHQDIDSKYQTNKTKPLKVKKGQNYYNNVD